MIHKTIDLTGIKLEPVKQLGPFGGSNGRESYAVTTRFLVKNGKACFPVMGEFHYSRYPAEYWNESLLKMKAGGIDVVSTYVFWIHHEEKQGKYDWSGNKNLRRFLELCGRHGLKVMLRIGPWVHGECRNGGFPDWLVHMNIPLRENNEEYLRLVKIFYSEIFRQVKGLLFSDGGPVFGIQIENEYGHCGGLRGEVGKEHIRVLKKIAVETGFQVPFYTTTGWGSGVVVEGETLPVLGGYAEAPWEPHIQERSADPGYLFRTVHHETDIGTDLSAKESEYSYDVAKYPYLTAELGGGLEPTHHRRPIISGDDTGAMAFAYLGSGASLLGYYMYHGGTNPLGILSTMQESKKTGSLNDYPALSYDFQAPINEYGQLNESYGRLKALHLFLHDFGEEMAQTVCFLPEDNPQDAEDMKNMRYSVRYGKKGGFLFLNNYQRRHKMTEKKDICCNILSNEGTYQFQNMNLADGDYFFYPFNFNLDELKLLSATAQPLCRIKNKSENTYVFFCNQNDTPYYRFFSDSIENILSDSVHYNKKDGICELKVGADQFNIAVPIELQSGKIDKIITIAKEKAYQAWKFRIAGEDYLILANACLYYENDKLDLVSDHQQIQMLSYPALPGTFRAQGISCRKIGANGSFTEYLLEYTGTNSCPAIHKIYEQKNEQGVSYEFSVNRTKGNNIDDDLLCIKFEGDYARLFIDGKFSADWYYNGNDWKIGLKRFGDLNGKIIRIDVDALRSDDFVFLEKRPEFQNGTACSVKEISVAPIYHASLFF